MHKAIKIFAGIIGLLIILAIAAVVCLISFVNPNDFKNQISAKVAAYTGRQLTINGEIKWSFFPWLGLQLNQVSLSNAAGFGNQPFAEINHADVKVQMLPLLQGEIKVGKLNLDGLQLNLMKNKQGLTNWQDLTQQAQSQAKNNVNDNTNPDPATKSSRKFKFAINGVDINKSRIAWHNQQNGQVITISDLSMQTGQLAQATAFPLAVQFNINSNQPVLNGNFNLKSDVSGDFTNQSLALKNLVLTSTINNKTYANGRLTINLQGDIKADLAKETVAVNSLNAKVANLQIQGNLQVQQILSNMQLQGKIKIPEFNLKQLLAALGQPLPARQDPAALTRLAISGNLQATTNSFKLSQLTAQLDKSHLSGNLAVTDFSKKALVFNINMDQLNADNYLAAQANVKTASNGFLISSAHAATSDNQALLPVETLRALNLQGRLQIDKLYLKKLDASAVSMQLKAQNGLINLTPLSARLYQGSYNGNMTIDVRANTPMIKSNNQLSGIQIEPLMHDLTTITKLQMAGAGSINVNITTQGNTEPAIISHLNGQGRVALNNGLLKGINIPYWVSVGKALINRNAPPAMNGPNQTAFGNLTGTFKINNGVLNNNDLLINAPTFQAKGNGLANLVRQYIDYRLMIQLMEPDAHKPQGDPIPLVIKGNFADVMPRPDVESILKQQLQKQVQGRVTSELQKRLGNDTGKAVGDAVNSLLQQFAQ